MQNNAQNGAIDTLRKEVKELTDLIKQSDTLRQHLRSVAEEVIVESRLVQGLKSVLLVLLAAGSAVWFGGAVYGGFQIKSLRDQSTVDLQQLREYLKEKQAEVDKAAQQATSDINSQREKARQKLAVDAIPDLATLKTDLAALQQSSGKLNLKTLSALSHWSVWGLLAVAALACIISVWALIRT